MVSSTRRSVGQLTVAAGTVAALTVLGVFGTGTEPGNHWPSLAVLGAMAITALAFPDRLSAGASNVALSFFWTAAGYIALRALLSPVPYFARLDLIVLAFAALVYGLCTTCLRAPRFRKIFLGAFLALALGNTICAVYQVFIDPEFSVVPGTSRNIRDPFAGGFYNLHPHLAGFLAMVAPYAFAIAMVVRGCKGVRVTAFSIGLACCVGIALSRSRGGMLSLMVGLLVLAGLWILYCRWKEAEFKVLLLALGGVFFVSVLTAGIILFGG